MDACKVAAKGEFTVLAEKGMLRRKALVAVPFFYPDIHMNEFAMWSDLKPRVHHEQYIYIH